MADYDYGLPQEAIAQEPTEPRDAARLLVAIDRGPAIEHRRVRDLPDLLAPGDLLVVNDTRVLPARLRLCKDTGGQAEVLLLEPLTAGRPGARTVEGMPPDSRPTGGPGAGGPGAGGPGAGAPGAGPGGAGGPGAGGGSWWEALVRPGRRLAPGTVLRSPSGEPLVEVGERLAPGGTRVVRLLAEPWAFGEVPLPPYLRRGAVDAERYQTVYAARPGSVAAPTAGLHLTAEVLDRCRSRGVDVVAAELVVGLDTFRPVTVEDPSDHVMHTEAYRVPEATWERCRATRAAGGRVVAVGTTTVRALESVAVSGQLQGRTDLYIRGDHPFAVVDVLLTNFHLPRSSLLLLVEAFVGDRWRHLYREALGADYRFLSLGDAMLVDRAGGAR